MTISQPDVSALARKWATDVNTGSTVSPTWTRIGGVQEFKPNLEPNLEDDATYDEEGWGSSTKTGLAWTLELKVIRRHDPADVTDYDPGQEKLRAAAELFGSDGVVEVRWFDREGGPEAYHGFGEVSWTPDGGNRTALETVSVVITGKGQREAITNPDAAS